MFQAWIFTKEEIFPRLFPHYLMDKIKYFFSHVLYLHTLIICVQALSVSFTTLSTLHYQMFIFSISGRINDQHSKHRGYGTGCYFVWYFNNQDFALPLNLSESINLYSTRQGRPFKSAIANMVNIFKFDTDEHIWIPPPSSSELWSDLNMCSN